ncbi:3-oxo-tetronate kinase [Rhizobium sp. IMFF44]|uniref:3-oxo-tetronate kinase n=1 Tax=Rhizobium sp. IMFF44 TaxID=3342350 RepID=UPI0035BA8FAE
MAPLLIGCVADDFTGATDVANIFARGGLKTTVLIGVPADDAQVDAEAIVIALKTRTIHPSLAVEESLNALRWLRQRHAQKYYFKYCSTFDSTHRGNIGPVTEAFLSELDSDFTIACPAFPANGRTIYKGNLFVGDVPLNESGMRNHPLTPMKDSNLIRVLAEQTKLNVSGCYHETVQRGASAITEWARAAKAEGIAIAVTDALGNDDLVKIAKAFQGLPLFTGASGLAYGLVTALGGGVANDQDVSEVRRPGLRAVISGSCSVATNGQVETMLRDHEGYRIDVDDLASGKDVVGEAVRWAKARLGRKPILIYATANPEEVKANQEKLGVEAAGTLVEDALSAITLALVENGVSELIVAGGETSGAVVKALDVKGLKIGREIAPGVPWVRTDHKTGSLALALKSGNFGNSRFFLDAWEKL